MAPDPVQETGGRRMPLWLSPPLAAAAGSLVLSVVTRALWPFLNNDGVVYLFAARAFSEGGLEASRQYHQWPFYSIVVAVGHDLTGLSFEVVARLLNAGLLAVLFATFVLLVRELGGSRRQEWLAVAVILTHPGVNHFRGLVIRDYAMWAMAFLALLCAIRSRAKPRWPWALAWTTAMSLALLFRPEAVAVALAVPVAISLERSVTVGARLGWMLVLFVPLALALGALGTVILSVPGDTAPNAAARVLGPWGEPLGQAFLSATAALEGVMLPLRGREYAPYILASGLLAVLLVKIAKAMGLVHLVLALPGISVTRPDRTGYAQRVLACSMVFLLGANYIILVRLLFLETRYAVPVALILSLWCAFGVERLMTAIPENRRRMGWATLALLGCLSLVNGLWPRPSDRHVHSAVDWIRSSTPTSSRLCTNSLQIAYFSERSIDWSAVLAAFEKGFPANVPLAGCDYVAVEYETGAQRVVPRSLDAVLPVEKSFSDAPTGRVVVYRAAGVSSR